MQVAPLGQSQVGGLPQPIREETPIGHQMLMAFIAQMMSQTGGKLLDETLFKRFEKDLGPLFEKLTGIPVPEGMKIDASTMQALGPFFAQYAESGRAKEGRDFTKGENAADRTLRLNLQRLDTEAQLNLAQQKWTHESNMSREEWEKRHNMLLTELDAKHVEGRLSHGEALKFLEAKQLGERANIVAQGDQAVRLEGARRPDASQMEVLLESFGPAGKARVAELMGVNYDVNSPTGISAHPRTDGATTPGAPGEGRSWVSPVADFLGDTFGAESPIGDVAGALAVPAAALASPFIGLHDNVIKPVARVLSTPYPQVKQQVKQGLSDLGKWRPGEAPKHPPLGGRVGPDGSIQIINPNEVPSPEITPPAMPLEDILGEPPVQDIPQDVLPPPDLGITPPDLTQLDPNLLRQMFANLA